MNDFKKLFKSNDLKMQRETEESLQRLNHELGRKIVEISSSHCRSSTGDHALAMLIADFGKHLLEKRLELDKELCVNRGLPVNDDLHTQLSENLTKTYYAIQQEILTNSFYEDKGRVAMSGPAHIKKLVEERLKKDFNTVQNEIEIFILDNTNLGKSEKLSPQSSPLEEFLFVGNEKLRQILLRDFKELNLCHEQSAIKATLIMAGTVLEALLLDALLSKETLAKSHAKKGEGDLKGWNLENLLEVALELYGINRMVFEMSWPVRKMRNLIHPGKELRQESNFDQSEATIAINVINIVIRDLKTASACQTQP